ncbi:hypothetical protein M405DRAFT_833677 [Rhizopogon salebrosus TDB-379]|nr:hypothetical protein M405DRAFT_833677 [Rhizopogon salebrosus TDB-379]
MAGYSDWKAEFLIPTRASRTWALLMRYHQVTTTTEPCRAARCHGWFPGIGEEVEVVESESDACGRGLVLSRAPCPRSDEVDHLLQLLLIESAL